MMYLRLDQYETQGYYKMTKEIRQVELTGTVYEWKKRERLLKYFQLGDTFAPIQCSMRFDYFI